MSYAGQEVAAQNSSSLNTGNDTPAPSRRAKFGNLDWTSHQAVLKKLYLDENKTLTKTIEIMRAEHSFHATPKLYKEEFKEWDWQKNLPASHARFMTRKSKKRKMEEGKDTIFAYGGQQWTSKRAERSLARTKKVQDESSSDNIVTPTSVRYNTPRALTMSPSQTLATLPGQNLRDPSGQTRRKKRASISSMSSILNSTGSDLTQSSEQEDVDVGSDDESEIEALPLSWEGFTRTELLSMWNLAQSQKQNGNTNLARVLLLQVLEGYRYLLGSTHEDVTKAAYALANLHAEENNMREADKILEGISRDHIKKLGYKHKRTQQHVLHSVELLNSWNRQADAFGFLAHSEELLQRISNQSEVRKYHPGTRARANTDKGKAPERQTRPTKMTVSHVTELMAENRSPTNLEFGLGFAQSHISARDGAVEGLLLKIIEQCQISSGGLEIQHLNARAKLLSLYEKLDSVDEHSILFGESEVAFKLIWLTYNWDHDKFQSIEVIEAGMQLAVSILKEGYQTEAREMFIQAQEKSVLLFGAGDERAIWVLISIGLVYQKYVSWVAAEHWFQHAFASALGSLPEDDGIVQSLQRALEKEHFSYLSDEDRPFKSVFGVTGITIRPGRLHLD
ncbi:hypothetical protein F5B20DRAFT_273301 [Whalleya microplaca]|nr:hypothetical protein F5B20DRAFT_273301 [Whalleya microplaca]